MIYLLRSSRSTFVLRSRLITRTATSLLYCPGAGGLLTAVWYLFNTTDTQWSVWWPLPCEVWIISQSSGGQLLCCKVSIPPFQVIIFLNLRPKLSPQSNLERLDSLVDLVSMWTYSSGNKTVGFEIVNVIVKRNPVITNYFLHMCSDCKTAKILFWEGFYYLFQVRSGSSVQNI